MYLKDFDIDFVTGERDLSWRLGSQVRSIMALYARCLPRLKVDGGWKVLVECMPSIERGGTVNSLGCFIIQIPFNLDIYQAKDVEERKRIALDTIHQGALAVASSLGWPLEPFETAYKGVVERNYVNEWTWPKSPKSSPDRKHKAYLQCLHEHDGFYAWIVVEDKKGSKLVKEFAFKELPSEFSFVPKLGKLIWSSNERVVLLDRSDKEVKAVSL